MSTGEILLFSLAALALGLFAWFVFDQTADCGSICLFRENKPDGDQYLEEIPAKGKVLAK